MTRTANELRDDLELALSLISSCRLDAEANEMFLRLTSRFEDNEGAWHCDWRKQLRSDDE